MTICSFYIVWQNIIKNANVRLGSSPQPSGFNGPEPSFQGSFGAPYNDSQP